MTELFTWILSWDDLVVGFVSKISTFAGYYFGLLVNRLSKKRFLDFSQITNGIDFVDFWSRLHFVQPLQVYLFHNWIMWCTEIEARPLFFDQARLAYWVRACNSFVYKHWLSQFVINQPWKSQRKVVFKFESDIKWFSEF